MSLLTYNLGNEQQGKVVGLVVMCSFCQIDKGSAVLASFMPTWHMLESGESREL